MIVQIVLGPAELSSKNAFILNGLDVLNNGIKIRQGYSQKHIKGTITRIPYIVIDCNIKMSKKKSKEFKKYVKQILEVEEIYFVIKTLK